MVYVTLTVSQVILIESFLVSRHRGPGTLDLQGRPDLGRAPPRWNPPWLLILPAAFLATTLFCFDFIGDGLREALDPKVTHRDLVAQSA